MKKYQELTLRYLKAQKKRTILTIMGVISSVALITGLGILMLTMQNKEIQNTIQNTGFYHFSIKDTDKDTLKQIKNHLKVDRAGIKMEGGVAKPLETGYISVAGYDEDILDIMKENVKIVKGKLPKKENEIAIEEWIVNDMKEKPQIGENISLTLYDQTGEEAEEELNEKLYNYEYEKSEIRNKSQNIKTKEKIFKVVGILENSPNWKMTKIAKGIVTLDEIGNIKGNNVKDKAFIRVKDKLPIQESKTDILQDFKIDDKRVTDNEPLLKRMGESGNAKFDNSLIGIGIFLASLIFLATVAIIYNSFHISVVERVKQFGILRSIGTSPHQIKRIVLGESLVIGLISIPFGLIFGTVGVSIVLKILNAINFTLSGNVKISIDYRIIIVSSIVGILSVLVSAFLPAYRASKVSPIEAIMNTKVDKKVLKKIRKSWILKRIFGVEGEFAYKNIWRNKGRLFITAFSMCISIVLLIVFSTFIKHVFDRSVNNVKHGSDFILSSEHRNEIENGLTENDYNKIKNITGVKKVYSTFKESLLVTFPKEKFTKEALESKKYMDADKEIKTIGKTNYFKPDQESSLLGVNTEMIKELEKYLISGSVDENKINKENGVIIVPGMYIYDTKDKKQEENEGMELKKVDKGVNLKVGDYIYVDEDRIIYGEDTDDKNISLDKLKKLKIVGILEKFPSKYNYDYNYNTIDIVTTEKVLKTLTKKKYYDNIQISLDNNEERYEYAKGEIEKLVNDRKSTINIFDKFEEARREREQKLGVGILAYGFVTVIALIGTLNIINTIGTNLILRTREFGMLRATGMHMKQMKKMILVEGILYGIIGGMIGTVTGTGLSYILYKIMIGIGETKWTLPINAIIISVVGSIVISLLATLIPLKRVSKMNIIDSISIEE
ncbi:ABC-type transport system, involved in lipoprotein release, permease component [Gottschalkia purinilytica]|uniref:ABC-type transport system, involved in lipoprotein release, permease component n=1 Tax=Gottschalkia purinilytica TaxID=1503 RepID=A0A0L0W896_GOTPU|nr:FtsX-like permease family protein [Gottschalkia purinilytica]KNF07671.1 ABC-type transport system, involved in lipoprotein release, permease component [Gottschalkia purinilytica]